MAKKTKIKLTENQINLLTDLPEHGMGYQVVDVKLKNGKVYNKLIVFNSAYLQIEDTMAFDAKEIDTILLNNLK
jgi:hypothetical protein